MKNELIDVQEIKELKYLREFKYFEIKRGSPDEESGERMDAAVKYLKKVMHTNKEILAGNKEIVAGNKELIAGQKDIKEIIITGDERIGPGQTMIGWMPETG